MNLQQLCNFIGAYKQGTPMMLMGDEYGHTRYGNNNSYGHDTIINHFQWEQVILYFTFFLSDSIASIQIMTNYFKYLGRQLDAQRSNHFRFFSEVIKFRLTHHLFRQENFLNKVISLSILTWMNQVNILHVSLSTHFLWGLWSNSFMQDNVTWHEDNWDVYDSKFLAFT